MIEIIKQYRVPVIIGVALFIIGLTFIGDFDSSNFGWIALWLAIAISGTVAVVIYAIRKLKEKKENDNLPKAEPDCEDCD